MRFCERCGQELEPGSRFCTNCGASVGVVDDRSADGGRSALPSRQAQPGPSARLGAGPAQAPVPPMRPAPNMANVPNVPNVPLPPNPAAKSRRRTIVIAVVAVVAVIALVIAGVFVATSRDSSSRAGNAASAAAPKTKTKKKDAKTKRFAFDAKKLDRIVDGVPSASVALATTDGKAEYASKSAGDEAVASGLYLPVYLAATDDGRKLSDAAGEMLRTMSNDAANQLIDDAGGLDAVNDWLRKNGYEHTELQRRYGDTAASAAGKENRTTAKDAANMLMVAGRVGAGELMDLGSGAEGVSVPSGVTVNGNYGQGIQNAYNYFLVVKDGDESVAVAVLTQGQGRDAASGLVSDLLAEIHREIDPDGADADGKAGGASENASGSDTDGKTVQLTQSYTTQYGAKNGVTVPALTFRYPSDWRITESDAGQESENVVLTNARGVTVDYYFSLSPQGRFGWDASISKLADASFDAPVAQATGNDLGPFMVAKVSGEGGQGLALLPESMQGTKTVYGAFYIATSFHYPSSSNCTSFATGDVKGGLTAQETREVTAILASLKG